MLKLFGGATAKADPPVVDQIVTFFGVNSTSITLTSDQVGIMAVGSFLEDNNPITYTDSADWTVSNAPTTLLNSQNRLLVASSNGPASSNPRWTSGKPAGRAVKFSNSGNVSLIYSAVVQNGFSFSYTSSSDSIFVVYAVWCQDSNPASGTPSTAINGIMNTAGWTTLVQGNRSVSDPVDGGMPTLLSYRDGLWMSSKSSENILQVISDFRGMVAIFRVRKV